MGGEGGYGGQNDRGACQVQRVVRLNAVEQARYQPAQCGGGGQNLKAVPAAGETGTAAELRAPHSSQCEPGAAVPAKRLSLCP
jgi:hypothetical protein